MTEPVEFEPLPTGEQWSAYIDAWTHGWAAGVEEGRRREAAELAAIQRAGHRVVQAMTEIPPRDPETDRARRARIDARFEAMQTRGGAA